MWKFATLLIALVAVSNFQVAAQTAVPASVTVHLALEKRRYMVGQQIDVAVLFVLELPLRRNSVSRSEQKGHQSE